MKLEIQTHTVHTQIIRLEGRVEAFTVGVLRDAQMRLLEAGETNFIIDLQATTFIDSTGIALLVTLLKRARKAGGNVVLVKPIDPAVCHILMLTRFDLVFTLTDTLEAALKVF